MAVLFLLLNYLESTGYNRSSKKFFGIVRGVKKMTKTEKIKQALQQTKERRKNQIPVVCQLKINLNSASNETKEKLSMLFLEAKWLYNYIVADIENRLDSNAEKLKEVEIKAGENFESRICILFTYKRKTVTKQANYSSNTMLIQFPSNNLGTLLSLSTSK